MRCPFCSHEDSQVKDSRHTEDNTAIRRRRICDQCGSRFTTFERIQLRDLIVIKSNGQKETFDRDKMFRSLSLALRKRKVEQDKIEKIVISMLKRNNCSKAIDIVREARDILGANGLLDEYHIMRHLVNLETVKTYEGAEDVHSLILGKFQTNIDAF